jgi:antitoxin CcdA
MSTVGKRKISVTVDAELLAEIEASGDDVSARVNDALRSDLAPRRRQRLLAEFLDHLDETEGPLDTAEDEATIARFMQLLGGPQE